MLTRSVPAAVAPLAATYEDLTVIIPTLNEAPTIAKTLEHLSCVVPGASVVVADDDSTDGTRAIADAFAGPLTVRVLHRTGTPRGLTASVVDALKITTTPHFVVMDSDLQHPPNSVVELHAHASNGSDFAVGKRIGYEAFTWQRRAVSKGAQAITRAYLRSAGKPSLSDPMSGFFAGKTRVARAIIDEHEPRFEKAGFKVLVDLVKFAPRDIVVDEVAYDFQARTAGESKLSRRHYVSLLRQLGAVGRTAALFVSLFEPRAFGRFAAVGASGVLVNEGLLFLLHGVANLPLLIAGALAILTSVFWNFALNDQWTFRGARNHGAAARLSRFLAVASGGAAINWLILGGLTHWATGAHYLAANLVGIVAAVAWNYGLSRAWVWKR